MADTGAFFQSMFSTPAEEVAYKVISRKYNRDKLVTILMEQNKQTLNEVTAANIERLRDPNTVVVTTGQQVGLFGGPGYSLYKCLTAVKESRRLEKMGIAAVPVFWLATTDSDFNEIAKTSLPTFFKEKLTLKLNGPKNNKTVVNDLTLGEDIARVIHEFSESSQYFPHHDEIMSILNGKYRPEATFAEAFVQLFAHILPKDAGVIFFNPMGHGVAEMALPLFLKELFDHPSFKSTITAGIKLQQLGLKLQVNQAENISNIFFLNEHRERLIIRFEGRDFRIGDELISRKDMLMLVLSKPECFVPNALLRPLMEATVLPSCQYVAGPSEQRYFKQIFYLYDKYDLVRPRCLPREGFHLTPSWNVSSEHDPYASFLENLRLAQANTSDDAFVRQKLQEVSSLGGGSKLAGDIEEIFKRKKITKSHLKKLIRRSEKYQKRAFPKKFLLHHIAKAENQERWVSVVALIGIFGLEIVRKLLDRDIANGFVSITV